MVESDRAPAVNIPISATPDDEQDHPRPAGAEPEALRSSVCEPAPPAGTGEFTTMRDYARAWWAEGKAAA